MKQPQAKGVTHEFIHRVKSSAHVQFESFNKSKVQQDVISTSDPLAKNDYDVMFVQGARRITFRQCAKLDASGRPEIKVFYA